MVFRKSFARRVVESPWTTIAYGAGVGVLASMAMGPVTELLYKHEDDEHKKREEELRKQSPPLATLAGRLIELAFAEPTEERRQRLATVLHWGYGMGAGALYAGLRKRMPVLRKALGLPFGVLFALIGDEMMNQVLGLTPPPKAWPVEAHVRGLVGHIAYAAAAESAFRAFDAAAARL
jgi:uncharacterized membrane protein YagU involved in acid resistance